ncbi:hypothetical protein C8R43DRAFT_886407 [Mycena crocata]|nr:hypothetical protein C8R43DRAFT_886407 [Mycena crocata]
MAGASPRSSFFALSYPHLSVCRPLIDSKNRLFALLAGCPSPNDQGDDTYQDTIDEVTDLFAKHGPSASGTGRRGPFVAVSTGVSFGGGQQRPGNLRNNKINSAICKDLLANLALRRIIGFTNGMFQTYAPALHSFYLQQLRLLWLSAAYLVPLLPQILTVFAACTFNFGPNTVTLPHVDAANLAWGWCCITALGNFDPSLGGHLILWDLKLVIRFPPGSTIMIPSALLRHSNVAVQQGERRYSFTQFTAGGLFRWVYNGNCSDRSFFERATADQLSAREEDRGARWEKGLKMFQVWNARTRTFESSL